MITKSVDQQIDAAFFKVLPHEQYEINKNRSDRRLKILPG